jgi:hypothetical protein
MNPLMSIPKILQTTSSEYLPRLKQPSLECQAFVLKTATIMYGLP